MTLLVDELANELRQYRHSPMASAALAEHVLAIPRIHDALEAVDEAPELTADMAARARVSVGDEVIREATGTVSDAPILSGSGVVEEM